MELGDRMLTNMVFTAAARNFTLSFIFALTLGACSQTNLESHRLVAAHRGDQSTGEENSRIALSSAVRKQFPFIEIDVRISADKKLFLFHDRRLRDSNFYEPKKYIDVPVSNLTSKELKSIKLNPAGSKILFFEEALLLVKNSASRFLLDMKNESKEEIDLIITDLVKAEAAKDVIFQCQDLASLEYLRSNYPNLSTLYRAHQLEDLYQALKFRPHIMQVDAGWISENLVQRIKSNGAQILVKTLDSQSDRPETWSKYFDLGVDIILTDHPDALSGSLFSQ